MFVRASLSFYQELRSVWENTLEYRFYGCGFPSSIWSSELGKKDMFDVAAW
jgi:hypothetical protein